MMISSFGVAPSLCDGDDDDDDDGEGNGDEREGEREGGTEAAM
tara:strand:- start:669 stop:797 length:129 start_codon:yes stop_codon:yes gene_type:complete